MKNQTGQAIMWRGVTYPPGEDIPDAIAKEMNLAQLNKAKESDQS